MMVLYGITPAPLSEELRNADTILLATFYAYDVVFDGLARRSTAQLKLLMDRGPDKGYLLDPEKSLFIVENSEKKEAAKREFERAVLNLNYVDGGRYLGAYFGTREELEEWVRPKVEAWPHVVRT